MKRIENKKCIDSARLTSIMEDYLEAIYELVQESGFARVRDIAQRLNVKMPSVTSMLKTLSEKEYIQYEKYGAVVLTASGEKIGSSIRVRHDVLLSFLHDILAVDFEIANEEACKMEHALSSDTLEKLASFVQARLGGTKLSSSDKGDKKNDVR